MMDSRMDRSDYQLRLRFTNKEHYQSVFNKLKSKEMEGKLKVDIDDDVDADSNSSDSTLIVSKRDIKIEASAWHDLENSSSEDLFGLKPEFLNSLNITPPLVKWVNVTNFRCDKSELRDVFEMAGRVVACVVVHTVSKYAKIMYSHPLEAVQAISMLNGQMFYGQSLKVTLDPFAENALPLPKGLQRYGPGLGEMGEPLRDIVNEFERYVQGKACTVNRAIFASRQPVESYEPTSMRRTSETLGQFGPVGQKKSETSYRLNPFANAHQPGPSNSFNCPKPQNSVPMYSGNMAATPPTTGPMPGPMSGPNIRPMACLIPPRGLGPNPPRPTNSNTQGPSGSNLQSQQGPNLQSQPNFSGPQGPNFPNQTGPNYQGPSIPSQYGPNFQGPNPPGPIGFNQASINSFPTSPRGPNFTGPGPSYQGPNQGPNGPNIQAVSNFPNQGGPPRFQVPGQFAPNRFQEPTMFNQQGPGNGPPGPGMGLNNLSMVPRPVQSPGPMGYNQPQEKGILVLRNKDPVTLQITNLPPTVTFASLCSKLSTVGQVVSLQFTTLGCAVVRFGNPSEAERCFHYYSPARFANDLGR